MKNKIDIEELLDNARKTAMANQAKRTIHEQTLKDLAYDATKLNHQEYNEKISEEIMGNVSEFSRRIKVHDRNYFSVTHNAAPTDTQTVYAKPSELIDEDDLWGCDATLREGIQEAAYSPAIFEMMRNIRNSRKRGIEAEKEHAEFGMSMFDIVDNYIYKNSGE